MKWNFSVLLLVFSIPATAQQVYKCIDATGNASYQSNPCAPNEKNTKTWEAKPEPERAPPKQSLQPSQAIKPRRQALGHNLSYRQNRVSRAQQDSSATACRNAKSKRDKTLERVGLKRTYDLLQQLDDAVHRACR